VAGCVAERAGLERLQSDELADHSNLDRAECWGELMRWLLPLFCCASLLAQVPGAPGRTTGPGNSTHSVYFSPGLGTITCSGSSCSYTSGSVSPSSQVAFGNLHFTSTHDADFNLGGAYGSGTGQMQVSCNGGATWMTIAEGSGSVGGAVAYSYSTPVCSGVSNLNTLLFRAFLGGGGASSFNMSFESPSSVTISW
jgi:hypothetical protein